MPNQLDNDVNNNLNFSSSSMRTSFQTTLMVLFVLFGAQQRQTPSIVWTKAALTLINISFCVKESHTGLERHVLGEINELTIIS